MGAPGLSFAGLVLDKAQLGKLLLVVQLGEHVYLHQLSVIAFLLQVRA